MKKPVNYSTEQITTAKRDFIHDVEFDLNPDGSFHCVCDLSDTDTVDSAPCSETVCYDRTGERLPVLSIFGRQWVLWGRVCSLLGQQRQFLNYRIISNHDHVGFSAWTRSAAISTFCRQGCVSSAKAPRARCKTIFFDYGAGRAAAQRIVAQQAAHPTPPVARTKRYRAVFTVSVSLISPFGCVAGANDVDDADGESDGASSGAEAVTGPAPAKRMHRGGSHDADDYASSGSDVRGYLCILEVCVPVLIVTLCRQCRLMAAAFGRNKRQPPSVEPKLLAKRAAPALRTSIRPPLSQTVRADSGSGAW